MIGDCNDESNFPHKLLLTDTQASRLLKAFANNFSANMKFSKPQLSMIAQSGIFLGSILALLFRTAKVTKKIQNNKNNLRK